ncbi:ankyrin repeat-containing domain protein [Radiomyces spectabilis]|uniref:ankyrin repeat-containing domain protein n=1 Tax=Radiomyces spectabilis TaxID=64574 RepID=UPI00221FCED9|nr:ankyrin repeat-containing domain protein [Radiomyces spectabilis]KAI8372899.1 ankyrin repeat-containing domain protein [Radiomyces spectabilis]
MKDPKSLDNLWIAAGDGQLDRVKDLIETGADVNAHDEFGYTAMHAAVSYGETDIVKYLLSKGANVDIEDFEKDTPLYVAETVEMAQLLLDNGADPHHRNEDGITPAATAQQEGWTAVAELLAGITKEELSEQVDPEQEEAAALSHTQEEADMINSSEFQNQVEQVFQRLQEQGGVENEEELEEIVTKIVLDEMRRRNMQ